MPTIHKERRERLEDKNNIIQRLNKRIEYLNQLLIYERMIREESNKDMIAPIVFQVIEDKGSHIEVKTVIRQSMTAKGYELLIC